MDANDRFLFKELMTEIRALRKDIKALQTVRDVGKGKAAAASSAIAALSGGIGALIVDAVKKHI